MNIAIIGGGITGLTAGHQLLKKGHQVTIFERENYLGGLAYGFKQDNWDWHLEAAYHHLFTNDSAIINLAYELGIEKSLIYKRPNTANLLPSVHVEGDKIFEDRFSSLEIPSVWSNKPITSSGSRKFLSTETQNNIAQLDSPLHLLRFPGLSFTDKLRTGSLAAFCKLYPFWLTLEGVTAKEFFITWGGKRAWELIWEPLMVGKFGEYHNEIAASWLWARIHKRTPSLVYFEGGFQTLINTLADTIVKNGGKIYTSTVVESIKSVSSIAYTVSWKKQEKNTQYTIHNTQFDKVLLTTPTPIALKLMSKLETRNSKLETTSSIPHLHAQVLILETKEPILNDVYWLSITDRSFPFLAVVAHTNFMDKSHYGGNHITYIGNYLPDGHTYLKMTKEQLLKEFTPFIKRLNQTTHYSLLTTHLFTAPFAQPVHQINYSKKAPMLQTSIPNVYLANMDSIFPWDRGTNYAVELGIRAAAQITL